MSDLQMKVLYTGRMDRRTDRRTERQSLCPSPLGWRQNETCIQYEFNKSQIIYPRHLHTSKNSFKKEVEIVHSLCSLLIDNF